MFKAQKRYEEVDILATNLYENYVMGKIPERQYISLMKKYDEEQTALEQKLEELNEKLGMNTEQPIQIHKFIRIIKKYKDISELNEDLVRELIDKIVIYEPMGKRPDRQQQVDIYFNFIGQFDLFFTETEIAEAKAEAEREKAEKQKRKAERARERTKAFNDEKKPNDMRPMRDINFLSVIANNAVRNFGRTAIANDFVARAVLRNIGKI